MRVLSVDKGVCDPQQKALCVKHFSFIDRNEEADALDIAANINALTISKSDADSSGV